MTKSSDTVSPFKATKKKKPPQEICFDKVFFSPIISFYFSAVFEYIEWRFLFTIHYVINVACIPECNIFFDESNENNEEKRPYLHFPLVFLTVRISHELMYSLNDNREGFWPAFFLLLLILLLCFTVGDNISLNVISFTSFLKGKKVSFFRFLHNNRHRRTNNMIKKKKKHPNDRKVVVDRLMMVPCIFHLYWISFSK